MEGIVSSSVGYTGGQAPSPTYKSVCAGDGHTEALRLVYDPKVVSYEDLMKTVMAQAAPFPSKAQYKSAVWAQDATQAAIASKVAAQVGKAGVPVLSQADTKWHEAEEYHRTQRRRRHRAPC